MSDPYGGLVPGANRQPKANKIVDQRGNRSLRPASSKNFRSGGLWSKEKSGMHMSEHFSAPSKWMPAEDEYGGEVAGQYRVHPVAGGEYGLSSRWGGDLLSTHKSSDEAKIAAMKHFGRSGEWEDTRTGYDD